MNNTYEIAFTEDVLEKLGELAGDKSQIEDYLNTLIQRLHARKSGQGGVVDLEQTIVEIHELLENEKRYQQEIYNLEQRLRRALAAQQSSSQTANWQLFERMQRAKPVGHYL